MRRRVLVVSNPEDEHTKRVVSQIAALGTEPVVFFPELLGSSLHLGIAFRQDNEGSAVSLSCDAGELDLRSVSAIWYRRPRPVLLGGWDVTQEGAEFAGDEWRAALEGTYALLEAPLWVSHPDRQRDASRKPLQLALARRVGFLIPRTLITNSLPRARAFVEECNGGVVVKATGSGWVYSEERGEIVYVLTNRVTSTDLGEADDFEMAPVTVQEEIAKDYEVRVNVVGQEVLAIRIDSQKSEVSQVDWRRYDLENTPYESYKLPESAERQCLRLTQSLGLEFGAIDLVRRPDGQYVFLEINPNGQFLWAEEASGVNVSSALARLLSGVAPPLSAADLR